MSTTISLTFPTQAHADAFLASIGVEHKGSEPALESAPKAPTGKVFRSKPGKAQAKLDVEQAWTDAKAKAGVKRVKDLSPKARAAVDAQVKAIWAAVPKTRTTKA